MVTTDRVYSIIERFELTDRLLDWLSGSGVDWEAESYPGQAAVEYWILDALSDLLDKRFADAEALLNAYSHAPWDRHEQSDAPTYRGYYPRDGACQMEDCSRRPLRCPEDGVAYCVEHAEEDDD